MGDAPAHAGWDRGLAFKPYMSCTADSYGVSYPSRDPTAGEPVYIVARYSVGLDLIHRYAGLLVYNLERAIAYDFSDLQAVPTWVTQVYDEDWLKRMISECGGFRR